MTIASNEAIADSGTTQIFIMDGTPVHNKQKMTCSLKAALADGRRVMLTHMCNIIIPGLPTTLVGCIVPELSIASLFGIHVLTEAGCTVDSKKCVVKYNGKIIITCMKDLTTDLWTFPIVGSAGKISPMNTHDKQDAFVNLRKEFMEGASAACSFTTLALAIPIFASTQAYKTEKAAKEALTNPPPIEFGLFSLINRCAAPKSQHSSKQSDAVSLMGAQIYQPKE